MPTYEFLCKDCKKEFMVHMTISERDKSVPKCPTCKGGNVSQLMTAFTAKTASKS